MVLKDGDGNIYVDMTSYGMEEGSFDETIGVVPKEIYDGYMDWLIGKLTGGGSNTPTDEDKEPVTPPATNTTNDHKAELENETDVETKIELTEDEKSAIASGEGLETKGLVTFTFEMPEELKNKEASVVRTYKVMRYHDGNVNVLDAKYDAKTGKLSFETGKFSTYAIVYSDAKTNSTTTSTPAPQTGDATNTFVYITLLSLALCSVVFVLRKQRNF